jgi:lambda repressor-like predicted transcriptional regulator
VRREDAERELRKSWAGHCLLDEVHLAELRAIVSAHLGEDGSSLTSLAKQLHMSPGRLRSFLSGSHLRERAWEKIAEWCAAKPSPDVEPETVAVGLLARWSTVRTAQTIRQQIAHAVLAAHAGHGISIPARERAALEALAATRAGSSVERRHSHAA